MDGKTLQVVQKLTLQVNVKNVGGFTSIQEPKAKQPKLDTGGFAETIEGIAESALPDTSLNTQDDRMSVARDKESLRLSDHRRIAPPFEAVLPAASARAKVSFP